VGSLLDWLHDCWLGALVRDVGWLFPIFEGVHFAGMALLIGVIGVIDLRVLGFARGLPLGPLHRYLPLAFVGFGLNAVTGVAMFATDPRSYWEVPSFRFKMLLILLAGLNAIWFWVAILRYVDEWGSGVETTRMAKIISAASLLFWFGVIVAGRFIAFAGNDTL
jgi:hypothetical protein